MCMQIARPVAGAYLWAKRIYDMLLANVAHRAIPTLEGPPRAIGEPEMRDIHVFAAADNCPHPPGPSINWQESALYCWHDLKSGVGGFLRLGQEVNVAELNCCFGMFSNRQRFRANVTGMPMVRSDRSDTHMGWGEHIRVDLGTNMITADFPDCETKLRFEDFFSAYDYAGLVGGPPLPDGTPHHLEVGGRVTGTVRLGDEEITIDGLGYRDRSWGPRNWSIMRSTRWWPCVFGPDLTIHVLGCTMVPGTLLKCGFVMRNGEPLAIVDSDILVTTGTDAISPISGSSRLVLENGETLELSCETRDGIVMHVRGYTAVEAIGVAKLGDRIGMSNLEVCTNPTGGNQPPIITTRANNGVGLSRR